MNIYENLLVYNSRVFLLFVVQSTDGQTNTLIGKTKSSTEKTHFIVSPIFLNLIKLPRSFHQFTT
jgi:hypothetical protein